MLDRLQLAWLALRRGKSFVRIVPTWQQGREQPLPVDYTTLTTDGFKRNELVYRCISMRAQAYTEPVLRVQIGGEDAGDNHPLVQLIKSPWPKVSMSHLLKSRSIMLDIGGTAYWEKIRDRGGRVKGLAPIRPDRMSIIPSADGIASYKYKVGDFVTYFEPEDVIQFNYYDPISDFYGLAPLQVCARAADSDNERTDFTRSFFLNAAVPYGLLKTKVKLDEGETDRIKRKWKAEYGGVDNWHNIAVLDADADYQRLGLTQEEMSFPDLTNLAETRICMVFQIPPVLAGSMVGIEHSTYSNYAEARQQFWQDSMVPMVAELEDVLNQELAAEFGDNVSILIDVSEIKALQEDRTAIFDRVTKAYIGGLLMQNEGREEMGFEQVPGGDEFKRPAPSPFTDAIATERDNRGEPPEDEEPPEVPPKSGAKAFTKGEAETARQLERTARAHELAFARAARNLFRDELRDLLALLPKGRRKVDWLGMFMISVMDSLNGSRPRWIAVFQPLFAAVLVEQGEALEAQFGIAFDIRNPAVIDFIRDYTYKFAEKIGATTVEGVRELVARAEEEGWAIPELQRQLTELYDGWSEARAELIARSETIRASNAGARESYRIAGVQRLKWWTHEDDRRCDWCASMHGVTIGITESFWRQGDRMTVTDAEGNERVMKFDYETVNHPPLHSACRCFVLASFD